jgi:outer membrane protein assembly factor BamB
MAIPRDTEQAEVLAALEARARSKRLCRIPTMQPVIVRDLLIARDSNGLGAIGTETGQQRWRAALESATRGLEQRVWEDVSWGAISTTGDLVFAVDDWRRQEARSPQANCLSAYDVQNGKLIWQVGTTSTKTTEALRDGRFLTPPLPLDDQLYCLVEFPNGHEVVMLNTRGRVIRRWSLEIGENAQPRSVERRVIEPPANISRIAPPVYSDGTLLCAAPDGHVAAIDLVTGNVLWNVWLNLVPEANSPARYASRIWELQRARALAPDRWLATAAHIFGDRVVLTPFESNSLYCLDSGSGKLLWKAPRGDGVFVAGAFDGAVIVVGRSTLSALRLTDGSPSWSDGSPTFPNGLIPSGTGYFSGDQYCLPFASGSVGVVNLRTGRLRIKVISTSSLSLGNLVPSGESVFSVGLSNVRRLESQPAMAD